MLPVVRSLKLAEDSEFVSQQGLGSVTILDHLAKLTDAIRKVFGWHPDPAADGDASRERIAVEAVLKRLTVFREDVANVISVTFESQDANKAANIANAVADSYIATTLDAKLASTKVVGQWLQERLTELQAQATEAERALLDYKVANKLPTDSRGTQANELLANLRTRNWRTPVSPWQRPRSGSTSFSARAVKAY